MNEAKFTDFCVEMGVGNLSLIKRLFLAMDDDNTGALEAGEFLSALRLMCDGKLDKKRRKRRDEFAFRIFDDDRGGLIELPELEDGRCIGVREITLVVGPAAPEQGGGSASYMPATRVTAVTRDVDACRS